MNEPHANCRPGGDPLIPQGKRRREGEQSARLRQTDSPDADPGSITIDDIVREAQFLCDRLDSLEWMDDGYEQVQSDYFGHVEPSRARLKSALAEQRAGLTRSGEER